MTSVRACPSQRDSDSLASVGDTARTTPAVRLVRNVRNAIQNFEELRVSGGTTSLLAVEPRVEDGPMGTAVGLRFPGASPRLCNVQQIHAHSPAIRVPEYQFRTRYSALRLGDKKLKTSLVISAGYET
jgi:hypothetical protein